MFFTSEIHTLVCWHACVKFGASKCISIDTFAKNLMNGFLLNNAFSHCIRAMNMLNKK